MGFSGVISTTSPKSSAYDSSARGFFIAQSNAGVTLTDTQKNATNQLVIDLKAAGLWSKFKAVYPFVGGTATSHKFNLITPADTDAAFRLSFVGGGTHSSNGYLPNGTNAYADTFLIPSTALTTMSQHISYYSRTNSATTGVNDNGCQDDITPSIGRNIYATFYSTAGTNRVQIQALDANTITFAETSSLGFILGSRTSATSLKAYRNNTLKGTNTTSSTSGLCSNSVYIGGFNYKTNAGSTNYYGIRECAFASIGDGLTDLESQLFYQITEKYQVALGRNVNATQSFYYNAAYNNETNAFLFNTQITDNTIQTATNTLVSDLKTANIWTKMKALYPMVGGTATTHKFNLVNAQDSDAAFRLVFTGGWTHSATGATPNGTNAYANTYLAPSTAFSIDHNKHLSYYSRTNATTSGFSSSIGSDNSSTGFCRMTIRQTTNIRQVVFGGTNGTTPNTTETDSRGFYTGNRSSSTSAEFYKNGSSISTGNATNGTTSQITQQLLIGAAYSGASITYYDNKECAFASIGDSLNATEALALYNATQTFNTTLGRQV